MTQFFPFPDSFAFHRDHFNSPRNDVNCPERALKCGGITQIAADDSLVCRWRVRGRS